MNTLSQQLRRAVPDPETDCPDVVVETGESAIFISGFSSGALGRTSAEIPKTITATAKEPQQTPRRALYTSFDPRNRIVRFFKRGVVPGVHRLRGLHVLWRRRRNAFEQVFRLARIPIRREACRAAYSARISSTLSFKNERTSSKIRACKFPAN